MPNIKITYFDFPGRAEASRLALAIGGIPFEDKRLLFEEFATLKSTLPYGTLPLLTIDEEVYCQSAAILRYCGKLANLYPSTAVFAAQTDEVIDTIVDFIHGLEALSSFALADGVESDFQIRLLKYVNEAIPRYLGGLDKRLRSFGKGPWAVGDGISIADLAIYVCLLNISAGAFEVMTMASLDRYSRILDCYGAVKEHPKVVAWNDDIAQRAKSVREAALAAHAKAQAENDS